ncbi:Dyp-type peroxidase [Paraburkholderia sp. LEh10]|nr:Dyp-type peroxidase [Paraburkholderia sp. LEh10]
MSRSAILITATLSGDCTAAGRVRSWCGNVAALVRSVGTRVPDGNLSCVCGFGSDAWDVLFGAPRPISLVASSKHRSRWSARICSRV